MAKMGSEFLIRPRSVLKNSFKTDVKKKTSLLHCLQTLVLKITIGRKHPSTLQTLILETNNNRR